MKFCRFYVVFLLLLLFCKNWAQTKVVVLSDTHVMAPDLLVNDGTAWQNYLAADRKMVDNSKVLFDNMIEKIKTDIKPDFVFITGDLTKDGEKLSHLYVKGKLDELKNAGIQTLVIPGNHDRGTNGNAVYYNGDDKTPAEVADNDYFAMTYANYGYGSSSEREATSLTYVCEPMDGLVVIGIDSGKDAKVSATTLDWVCNKARIATAAGKQVVALMHHSLVPHFYGTDKFVETSVIDDYATARNALADAGIQVVFTGHFHTSDIAKAYNADLSKVIYDISTGSLISYPCDYREVMLSGDLTTLSITTGHITELDGDLEFGNTAKNRLKTSVENIVASNGYSFIKTQAADAFIAHAEGNEHESSDAASTLSTLLSYAKVARILGIVPKATITDMEKMANSMLKDISAYGEEGRENQTDDLSLVISMPKFSTISLTMNALGIMTYAGFHALDFSAVEGLMAYYACDFTEKTSTLTMKPVCIAPKGAGLMLVGTAGTTYSVPITTETTDDLSTNLLKGVISAVNVSTTDGTYTNYILANGSNGVGWYRLSSEGKLKASSAYLQLPTGSMSAPIRVVYEDDPTSVSASEIADHQQDKKEFWHTLTGIKLKGEPTESGLYIMGKKRVYFNVK